jgi:OOP family OmpA-OmpF porin
MLARTVRRTRARAASLACVSLFSAAAVLAFAPSADAQSAKGFSLDDYSPAERGSDWFANESLDLRGHLRPAAGFTLDYANTPLGVYSSGGSRQVSLVDNQFYAHVGGALTLFDRLRFGVSLPILLTQGGTSATLPSGTAAAPTQSAGVGDLRIGADVRLLGQFRDPFQLALGVQFFAPTGNRDAFTGDGSVRVLGRAMVSGDISIFTYSAQLGLSYHGLNDSYVSNARGNQFNFAAAAGVRVLDGNLVIGPEVWGATVIENGGAFTQTGSPIEAIVGGHYTMGDFKFGLGGGLGLTRGLGAPAYRLLASFDWFPAFMEPKAEPKKPEGPKDRDGDGIVDAEDACPDDAGIKTDDPKTNGCPDKDHDGIVDKVDACPTVKGVASDDPKKNGCPPDSDGDGIIDSEDACPKEPGIKTDDPKTNGCPDRDGDGIVDMVDACPDVKGVKSDKPEFNGCPADMDGDGIPNETDACPKDPGKPSSDPKKNGCPAAILTATEVKILDQVKFKTDSDVILPESDEILQSVAKILRDYPNLELVQIEGHTDNRGAAAHNKDLSKRRAASVMKWLTTKGKIDKKRLTSQGFGPDKPIDSNDTDEGRRNNRRVEFHIVKDSKGTGLTKESGK